MPQNPTAPMRASFYWLMISFFLSLHYGSICLCITGGNPTILCLSSLRHNNRQTFGQLNSQNWSPIRPIDEIREDKAEILNKIRRKRKLIRTTRQGLEKELQRRKNLIEGPDPSLKETVTQWLGERQVRPDELPPQFKNALDRISALTDKNQFLEALKSADFEISSESQLFAVVRLCNQFIYDFFDRPKIDDIFKSHMTDQSLPIYLSVKQKIAYQLNGPIDEYRPDARMFHPYIENINRANTPQDRVVYDAFRLLAIEEGTIDSLWKKLDDLNFEIKTKNLESSLIAKGVDLHNSSVDDIPYSEFHVEVANSFLQIVDRLGEQYGALIRHPGVQNRPKAFIRDATPLVALGKTPDEVWQTLKENKITLYRKLGGSKIDVDAIANQGMLSAFLRNGGHSGDLTGPLLRRGLNSLIHAHIGLAQLTNSPMISTTTSSFSGLAYSIAIAYSKNKGDPIHTYSLTVPIYDVLVANKHSKEIKSFEFLVWQTIDPSNVKHEYEESADLYLSSSEFADEMKKSNLIPRSLQEPTEP